MVGDGSFRQDLFYRLVVFPFDLPPLRDRREDVPLLVDHFIEKYARDANMPIRGVEPDAMKALTAHHWPGNVRELENVIHRSLLLADGPVIEVVDLPPGLGTQTAPAPGESSAPISVAMSLEELEKAAINKALKRHGGNLSDVARQLGIGRSTLYRKLEQYGLREKKGDKTE
jgi:Nif-specific regulatory protein